MGPLAFMPHDVTGGEGNETSPQQVAGFERDVDTQLARSQPSGCRALQAIKNGRGNAARIRTETVALRG